MQPEPYPDLSPIVGSSLVPVLEKVNDKLKHVEHRIVIGAGAVGAIDDLLRHEALIPRARLHSIPGGGPLTTRPEAAVVLGRFLNELRVPSDHSDGMMPGIT